MVRLNNTDFSKLPLEVAQQKKKDQIKQLLVRFVDKHYEPNDRSMLQIWLMTGNDAQKVEVTKVLTWINSVYALLFAQEALIEAVEESSQATLNEWTMSLAEVQPVGLKTFKEIALLT